MDAVDVTGARQSSAIGEVYIDSSMVNANKKKYEGLWYMSLFGDLFHITFPYLLEIISPIFG